MATNNQFSSTLICILSLSCVSNQASHHGCLLPSPPLPLCFHLRRLLPHKMSKSIVSSSALPSPPPSSASSTPLNSLNLSLWFQPMAGIASSSTTHHHRWWPKVSLSRLIFNTHLKIHIPLWKFNLSYYPLVLAPQSLV